MWSTIENADFKINVAHRVDQGVLTETHIGDTVSHNCVPTVCASPPVSWDEYLKM